MSAPEMILAQQLCAFAFCWRLDRRDGVSLGLTSHDRPLHAHGLLYEPAPGINLSAIVRSRDAGAELTEVAGALTAQAISADDLTTGRWDGATLALHLTEWTAPGTLWLELACGRLGPVDQDGDRFAAALQGVEALMQRPPCPETSPSCRATLGDRDCGVDLRPRQQVARIVVGGSGLLIPGLDGALYAFGSLRWLTGPMAGKTASIIDGAVGVITLAEAVPEVVSGSLALITQGCDKRLITCSAQFANAANFRGEPHLPGNDLLTRYPGG
jgi:uncharacterized phage protein (TIGR02218 family)